VLATTLALLISGSEERRQTWLDKSDQARAVGGYIDLDPSNPNGALIASIVNASRLPIRAVRASVEDATNRGVVVTSAACPVVDPGPSPTVLTLPVPKASDWVLVLTFDDDAGLTWMKYGTRSPLELVNDPYR